MGLFRKNTYQEDILFHYEKEWKNKAAMYLWDKGGFERLPSDFRILEFRPNNIRNMWTYATCAMSQPADPSPIELHIFSEKKDEGLIELLTAIAFYHRNTSELGLWHTVNFGRSWQGSSKCDHGLISLPYLDGPTLENLAVSDQRIKFYWLVPVTSREVEYKSKNGIEELELKFEEQHLNYLDPDRDSVIV